MDEAGEQLRRGIYGRVDAEGGALIRVPGKQVH